MKKTGVLGFLLILGLIVPQMVGAIFISDNDEMVLVKDKEFMSLIH